MISILSKQTVRPSPRRNGGDDEQQPRRIHLTPWDLSLLPAHYGQKALLFHKPQHPSIISNLFTSFSLSINHFYPLAGRLVTTTHDDDGSSITVSLDCTGEGAEFVHASAPDVTVSDILATDHHIPTDVIRSLFPLDAPLNAAGHSIPLLAAQVTELADGVFIACSLNHCVGDGIFLFHFLNTWSRICRTGEKPLPTAAFDRWFPPTCPPPLYLPFKYRQEINKMMSDPPEMDPCPQALDQCAFYIPAHSVAKLKSKANDEAGGSNSISSLQAAIAHLWRGISRARSLRPEQETTCFEVGGYRARLSPPLPECYLGSAVRVVPTAARAGEIEDKGLGWAASLLTRTVSGLGAQEEVREWFESWRDDPSFEDDEFEPATIAVTGSPRFRAYENDFGWGRPVAVRSGPGTVVAGNLTVYPAAEEGGMTFEVCLKAEEMKALLEDGEFMEAVA